MRKPKLLDLFCCQGGAGWGYSLAGFRVTGVDLSLQPRYPLEFIQADAITYLAEHGKEYDFIHASPPCQRYSMAQRLQGREHPDLLAPVREALESTGRPWVIENVSGARGELRDPITLCGTMFGLHTYRHRLFEFGGGASMKAPPHMEHEVKSVKMGRAVSPGDFYQAVGNFSGMAYVKKDMGVQWMSRDGVRECIPPAYTKFIGDQVISLA